MVKPVIYKRLVKGSALTFTEVDTSLQNLRDSTISIAVQGDDTIVNDLNDTTTFIAQDGIAINAVVSNKSIVFDASVLQDTTPQLGGDLDVNGFKIISTSNGNIELDPNGTGKVIISGDLQVDGTTTTINSTTLDVDDKNITLAKGAVNAAAADGGGITLEGPTTAATLLYEDTDDSWNFNKKTTAPELQIDNININGNSIISTDTNGNITVTPNGTGSIVLDGLSWPQADGQDKSVLTTDGAGNLTLEPVDNIRIYVTNAESITINKGQPVYAFSSDGNRVSVKLAYNTSDATSAQTLGLVAANITAGGQGYVISQGLLKNVDTSAYTAGQQLYLGATAGTLTATKPYAPNHLVYIAVVEVGGSSGAGRLFVKVQNGYELDEIHDVLITSPQDGDVLQYVASSDLWVNGPPAATGLGYEDSSLNYVFEPTGGANIYLNTDTVRIGDSEVSALITHNSANGPNIIMYPDGNLALNANTTANKNVYIGTDSQVVLGNANTGAEINMITYQTVDLKLSTNWNPSTGLPDDTGSILINSGSNENIEITPHGTGQIKLDLHYWPNVDGSNGQFLKTDGAGNLSWATSTGKTYTVSATSTSLGDAYITLTDNTSLSDSVKIDSGTGITVTAPDANTIRISREVYTWDSLGALTWDDLG